MEYDQAILDYTIVLELKPDFEWAYIDRGMMYFKNKNYIKAANDFKKALELKPNWTLPLTNLGKIHIEKEEYNMAIDYLNQAIQSDERNHLAHQNIGYVYFLQKEYDLAIESYSKAIEILPNYYNAIRSRADAKYANGDFKGSCNDIKLAAELGDSKAINLLRSNRACLK